MFLKISRPVFEKWRFPETGRRAGCGLLTRLTPGCGPGIHASAMRAILSAMVICLGAGRLSAQVDAPPEVIASAVAAVEDLGKQVVLGRHQAALERMYPPWKEKLAAEVGGMEKLEQALSGAGKRLAEQGIQFLTFETEGMPAAYQVGVAPEAAPAEGEAAEKPEFKQWLLIIPTVTGIRLTAPGKPGELPEMRMLVNRGFQVAISAKDENDWTFIDGSKLRVSELRRMFPGLPADLNLPEVKGEEKKLK